MEEITMLISNVGFPIAIATYIIVVVNKSIQELTKAVTVLTEKINKEVI